MASTSYDSLPFVFGPLLVGQQLQHLHVVGVSRLEVPFPEQVRLLHVGGHGGEHQRQVHGHRHEALLRLFCANLVDGL